MATVSAELSRPSAALPRLQGLRWYHLLWTVLLLVYPLVASNFWIVQIAAQTFILGLIALSLMLLAGYGGMVSLSQLTVAGLAGYLIAIFGGAGTMGLHWPPWVAIPLAVGLATLFAALIGWISVRTEGIYTIMITLAVAVAFYYFALQNEPIFNAFDGFAGIRPPTVLGQNLRAPTNFYFLCLAVAAFGYFLVLYLSRSPFGLALQAVRDNSRRMSALGFNVRLHRIAAHTLAGFLASLGGVLHPIGPFIGALIFILINNFAMATIAGERFNTLIGLVFLLIVLFSPDGVLGLWNQLRDKLRSKNARNRGQLGGE